MLLMGRRLKRAWRSFLVFGAALVAAQSNQVRRISSMGVAAVQWQQQALATDSAAQAFSSDTAESQFTCSSKGASSTLSHQWRSSMRTQFPTHRSYWISKMLRSS